MLPFAALCGLNLVFGGPQPENRACGGEFQLRKGCRAQGIIQHSLSVLYYIQLCVVFNTGGEFSTNL